MHPDATSMNGRHAPIRVVFAKIQDVQCVGVPDAKFGEELCACIILRPGMEASAEEMREFCRGQIADYKISRCVTLVQTFPKTVTGKIQKYLLRRQMAEELEGCRDGVMRRAGYLASYTMDACRNA
jgi:acyl-CoA synthetase (AMP-forming)/AMP-acid ligase II